MISKCPRPDGTAEVRFTVPDAFHTLEVVGDFNHWGAEPTVFAADGDERTAIATVLLGRRYWFRYTTFEGGECNDEAADDYEADPRGAYSGIIDLVTPVGSESLPAR